MELHIVVHTILDVVACLPAVNDLLAQSSDLQSNLQIPGVVLLGFSERAKLQYILVVSELAHYLPFLQIPVTSLPYQSKCVDDGRQSVGTFFQQCFSKRPHMYVACFYGELQYINQSNTEYKCRETINGIYSMTL